MSGREGGKGLYNDIHWIMGKGHMGPHPPWTDRHTSENITFPQIRRRAVNIEKTSVKTGIANVILHKRLITEN